MEKHLIIIVTYPLDGGDHLTTLRDIVKLNKTKQGPIHAVDSRLWTGTCGCLTEEGESRRRHRAQPAS